MSAVLERHVMVMMGLLGRLLGRGGGEGSEVGLKVKPGTDYVPAPLYCPACKREVSRTTPKEGLGRCVCGHRFALVDYEPKPIPKGSKLD